MRHKTYYAYITNYLKATVTDSQIINWLGLYEEQGVVFDLLIITGIKAYFKERKFRKSKIKQAKEKISGKIYQTCSIKPGTLSWNLILFMNFFVFFLKYMLTQRPIIIQTRTYDTYNSLKWLKAIYSKIIIILELRASYAEEFKLTQNMSNRQLSSREATRYAKLIEKEVDFIRLSDKCFSVSNKLKEYYLGKDSDIKGDKIMIIPGCADQNIFFWDHSARKRIRNRLGINDRIILVYSGGLDQPWQIPEFLFFIFSKLIEQNSKLFLMCITPNVDIVKMYVQKFNISNEDIWTNYVKYHDLNDYLCAADFGLLFRENMLVNRVASPTKFAEYVMSGLHVIISECIGDFSDFVKNHKIGLIIKNNLNPPLEKIQSYLINCNIDRHEVSELGKKEFSKQEYLARIINTYKQSLAKIN